MELALDNGQLLEKITRRGNQLYVDFSKENCDSDPSTEPPTEPPTIDLIDYHLSDEVMTYREGITYCSEKDMEMAISPNRGNDPENWERVS